MMVSGNVTSLSRNTRYILGRLCSSKCRIVPSTSRHRSFVVPSGGLPVAAGVSQPTLAVYIPALWVYTDTGTSVAGFSLARRFHQAQYRQ